MRIVFVRHGHPDYKNDCLTPLGHEQAKAAAARPVGLHGNDAAGEKRARPWLKARMAAGPPVRPRLIIAGVLPLQGGKVGRRFCAKQGGTAKHPFVPAKDGGFIF